MFNPGLIVFSIVDLHSIFRQHEWLEGVDHHGKFSGFCLSDTGFVGAWMWAVWNTSRVKRDMAWAYVGPAHEITINIVEHLIGVNIGVIIGRWNGLGVIVV